MSLSEEYVSKIESLEALMLHFESHTDKKLKFEILDRILDILDYENIDKIQSIFSHLSIKSDGESHYYHLKIIKKIKNLIVNRTNISKTISEYTDIYEMMENNHILNEFEIDFVKKQKDLIIKLISKSLPDTIDKLTTLARNNAVLKIPSILKVIGSKIEKLALQKNYNQADFIKSTNKRKNPKIINRKENYN